jgi:hypothetical protein
MPVPAVGLYLKRWVFTPQGPVKRAREQNPEVVEPLEHINTPSSGHSFMNVRSEARVRAANGHMVPSHARLTKALAPIRRNRLRWSA